MNATFAFMREGLPRQVRLGLGSAVAVQRRFGYCKVRHVRTAGSRDAPSVSPT